MRDSKLLKLFEQAVDPANKSAVYNALPKFGQRELDEESFLIKLATPISDHLERTRTIIDRPIIKISESREEKVDVHKIARVFVRIADETSPAEAVDRLESVLTTDSATGLRVFAVWGIERRDPMELGEGIELVPLLDIPDSPHKISLFTRDSRWMHSGSGELSPPDMVLTKKSHIENVFPDKEGEVKLDIKGFEEAHQHFFDAARALSLVMPYPVLQATSWYQFDEPDLQAICPVINYNGGWQDIDPFIHEWAPLSDEKTAKETFRDFRALETKVQETLRLGIDRLNLGRQRRLMSDRAVELAIALESVLTLKDERELVTFKQCLRAALFLGGDDDERVRTRGVVGALYRMRSRVVHGEAKSDKDVKVKCGDPMSPYELVKEGALIAQRLFRKIVHDGRVPDWYKLEVRVDKA